MARTAPREAFMAGHNITYTCSYFDQVMLAARLKNSGNAVAQGHVENMIEVLKRMGPLFAQRLQHVNIIAKEAGLGSHKLPALPAEYHQWAPKVHQQFLEMWSVSDVEGWFFNAGFSLGELRNALIVLSLALDFQINLSMNFSKELIEIEKRLKKTRERWILSAEQLRSFELGAAFVESSREIEPSIEQLMSLLDGGEDSAGNLLEKSREILKTLSEIEKHQAINLPGAT